MVEIKSCESESALSTFSSTSMSSSNSEKLQQGREISNKLVKQYNTKNQTARYVSEKEALAERKKNERLSMKQLKRSLFFWVYKNIDHYEPCIVSAKRQLCDFKLTNILTPQLCSTFDELLLVSVQMKWSPYISGDMTGKTTVYLCDMRSSLKDNVVKGGYHFLTSSSPKTMCIFPGYKVCLKDPNLHKIFRFVIITEGLDLDHDSMYAKMELKLHLQLGKHSSPFADAAGRITIVTGDGTDFKPLQDNQMGPVYIDSTSADLDHLLSDFHRLIDNENPGQAVHMEKFLPSIFSTLSIKSNTETESTDVDSVAPVQLARHSSAVAEVESHQKLKEKMEVQPLTRSTSMSAHQTKISDIFQKIPSGASTSSKAGTEKKELFAPEVQECIERLMIANAVFDSYKASQNEKAEEKGEDDKDGEGASSVIKAVPVEKKYHVSNRVFKDRQL